MLSGVYQNVGLTRWLIYSLLRLRQELSKLILKHTEKTADPTARSTTQEMLYELLLNGLSVSELFGLRLLHKSDWTSTQNGPRPSAHPKAQTEIAYWREREEELRRRMASTNRGGR